MKEEFMEYIKEEDLRNQDKNNRKTEILSGAK